MREASSTPSPAPSILSRYAARSASEIVADVIEHDVRRVAALDVRERVAAVRVDAHVDRIRVAEKIVDVAERLLIRADQEDAQPIRLAVAERMQRQADVDAVRVDVLIDAAVRIAGEIGDHAAPLRRTIEAFDRHDRKHLIDRPDVGDRFEHREIDEVLVDELRVQLVDDLPLRRLFGLQARAHRIEDRVIEIVEPRAIGEPELAERIRANGLRSAGIALRDRARSAAARRSRRESREGGAARAVRRRAAAAPIPAAPLRPRSRSRRAPRDAPSSRDPIRSARAAA